MKKIIDQLFKFGIVGVIAFIIDYSLLYILTEYFNVFYLFSSIVSFIVSLLFNYIASIKWVFDVNKKQGLKEISTFVILSVIGLGINQLGLYLMVEKIAIHYMISKIVTTIIVMIWNFITRKIFIEK